MRKYPEVKHKLPDLFAHIIEMDHLSEDMLQEPIIFIKNIKEFRARRLELSKAAEQAIKDMKKDRATP